MVLLLQDGNTAMHLAAYKDNLSVVKYLVEHGGDVNAKNNVGNLVSIRFPVMLLHGVIHCTMSPPRHYDQSTFLPSVLALCCMLSPPLCQC